MRITRVELGRNPKPKRGYRLPFIGKLDIFQGNHGEYSHFAKHYEKGITIDDSFATDFAMPFGSVVVASRSGRVFGLEDNISTCYEGLDLLRGQGERVNYILLKHQDEGFTVYSHLRLKGVVVKRGELVRQGQVIAFTGKSGWIGPEPHLHFAAYESDLTNTIPVIFDENGIDERLSDMVKKEYFMSI
ncbi:MAG: M23 family metallopeptidase [Nanoarchaeota archaeon]|nr:M23 family metallopeptidase [Nanoarchaeota archaeon]